jgi:CopG family nickel-responsive transcriptional regulator
MLRGKTEAVRRFADALIAERGVRHGQINLVPVDEDAGHGHKHGYRHVHCHPKT